MKHQLTALMGAALVALSSPAFAQSYPDGNIQYIVPYPPGGGTDVLARQLNDQISRQTGWNFVVQNQPGAGGTIGMDQLSRADGDGMTIGIGQTSNLAVNPALSPEVDYDPQTAFTPIALINTQPMGIITNMDSAFADFGDVLDAVRADPGSVLYGTPGSGTVSHMAIERLMVAGDLEFEHVPYTGIAQAISDVMGGVVDIYIGSLPSVIQHVEAGNVRLLAVTSEEPHPLVPETPTVASYGFDGYQAADWKAVVGPAGMPAEAVTAMNDAINAALADEDLRAALEAQGSVVLGGTVEEFTSFLANEVADWAEVVSTAGLR